MEKTVYDIVEDKKNGIDISEKYSDFKEKNPKLFECIDLGQFNKQHFEFLMEKKRELDGNNQFGVDKDVGLYFAPMLGDKFKDLTMEDLAKAEKTAKKKA